MQIGFPVFSLTLYSLFFNLLTRISSFLFRSRIVSKSPSITTLQPISVSCPRLNILVFRLGM
ncbi:hypothetical protein Hanom_Chr09g00867001 [Helianthus anomalus]